MQCECLAELLIFLYKCVYVYVFMGFQVIEQTLITLLELFVNIFMLYSKQSHMINSPMLLRTELMITAPELLFYMPLKVTNI